MSELTSTLKVVVDGSGARSGAAQVSSAINSMSKSAGSSVDALNKKVNTFNDLLKRVQNSSFGFLKSLAGSAAIAAFTSSLIKANREYSAFMAISKVSRGSLDSASESFENIKNISDTLGTSLEHNLKSFGKFEAAMRPIDKTGRLTQHMFEGLQIASSGLHMSSLQLELSFKAIEQAASKGKPSLEEFQRQLAEHIPGTMAYLAEGVGLRMDQIHEAISSKTISVKELLTGFANVLKTRFGDAAEYAARQLPAALERMRNAFFLFNVEIGRAGAAEALSDISRAIVDLVGNSQISSAIGDMFKEVGGSIATFIRSITPQDIANLQAALQMVVNMLLAFIQNIRTIFQMLIAGIIGRYLGLLVTHFIKIRAGAIAAGGGIKVFAGAMAALRATLGGPGGVIALLITLLPLLAKLGRNEEEDARGMDLINKQRMLKTYDASIKASTDAIGLVGKDPNRSIDEKIKQINNLYNVVDKLKLSREKLNSELMGKSEDELGIQALLSQMELPKDDLGFLGGDSGGKDKDPLQPYIDDTNFAKMKKYHEMLGLLNSRYANGDPTKLSKKQFSEWAEIYKQINDAFITDVFNNGQFKTFDSDVADFIKSQQDNINELNSDMFDASEELKELQKGYARDLESLSETLFGDAFTSRFSEISSWIADEYKKFDEMQLDPTQRESIVKSFQAIVDAKYKLAELEGTRDYFSRSQDAISSLEQSLQSRVIAGLISEGEARLTLRDAIGKQGLELQNKLLPVIQKILAYTSDPAIKNELQAIIDKIREMIAIGGQTNIMAGMKAGLIEYGGAVTDTFTMAKDTVVSAFKSMEDALVEFVKTGKMEFGSFVESILLDIARIAIQQSITQPLANIALSMFSANGNAFSMGQVQAFASGGILGPNGGMLTKPTIFPMANGGIGIGGEAGDEAVMPLKRLSNGKMGVYAEGGQAQSSETNVVVNVIESPGNGGKVQERMEGNTRIMDVLVEQFKSAVGADIARGGPIATNMERTYGLNRAAGAY